MLCDVIISNVMLHYILVCHTTSCYAIVWYSVLYHIARITVHSAPAPCASSPPRGAWRGAPRPGAIIDVTIYCVVLIIGAIIDVIRSWCNYRCNNILVRL